MAPKRSEKATTSKAHKLKKNKESPRPIDPFAPTTSRNQDTNEEQPNKKPCSKRCFNYLYDRENKLYCERSCKDWFALIGYTIMYLFFLSTYTMIFLYGSLSILKATVDYSISSSEKTELLTYSENGIGLSATPTSLGDFPLIWYKNKDARDYEKYVNAIDSMLKKRRKKREVNTELGPCGIPPYGYGDKPCILIRINKQLRWSGAPLQMNSSKAIAAPPEVQEWMKMDKKLWLKCNGYHSYDKEHVGSIKYYPNPPGFDPDVFPLDMQSTSPVVAIQISDFTLGLSLAIECKLWYEKGPSSVQFMLYVAPGHRVVSNRTNFSG